MEVTERKKITYCTGINIYNHATARKESIDRSTDSDANKHCTDL